MNHSDKIKFNGKVITIKDLLNKEPKEILVGLYLQTQSLELTNDNLCDKVDKIKKANDNQWSKISKNWGAIKWIMGVLFVIVPVTLYICYNISLIR